MKRSQARKAPAGLPAGIALAWGHTISPRRGPRPSHTIKQIVESAIKLADKQGISALSLPRIAASLGLTRNALYRYVRSKDELLTLIYDAGWGSPPESLFGAGNWANGIRAWTLAVIDGYRRRSWLLDVPITGFPATPNVLNWLEAFLRTISDSGLSVHNCLQCALLLDGYARSVVRLSRDVSLRPRTQKQSKAVDTFLVPLLQQRNYTILASIIGGQPVFKESPVDDVQFGLDRILDGINCLVALREVC